LFEEQVDSGRRIDRDFSEESYKFKGKIISSEFKEKIVDLINQYDFSQSCKISLTNIVNVSFDPNAMLARNDSVIPRMLQLEIELNIAKVAYDESDTQNPGLLNIEQTIIDAFSDFVSRSTGGKERDNITKQETTSHQSYSGIPSQQGENNEQPRRGFRVFK
jgi:hypothetical protein